MSHDLVTHDYRLNPEHPPFVKLLAERGADLQAKDANGRTPLDLAKGIGVPGVRQAAGEPFPETVALLESLMAAKGSAPSSSQ